jgi:murein L,D-transpeptidase YcbB/YkuD
MTTKIAVLVRAGIVPAAAALLLACQVAAHAEETQPAANADATAAAEAAKDAASSKSLGSSLGIEAPRTAESLDKSAGQSPDKSAVTSSIKAAKSPVSTAAAPASPEPPKPGDAPAAPATAGAVTPIVPEPTPPGESAAAAAPKQEPAKSDATAAEAKPAASSSTAVASPPAQEARESAPATVAKDAAAKKKPDEPATAATDASKPATGESEELESAKAATTDAAAPGAREPIAAVTEETKPADAAKTAAAPIALEPAQPENDAGGITTGPKDTAALPEPAPGTPASAGVSDQILPPADPIVAGVRHRLESGVRGASRDDADALVAYYGSLDGPAIWVSTSGLTPKAKAVIAEIGKADDWGLPTSDFEVPSLPGADVSDEAAADAEIKVAAAVLKYARYARGGRIDPSSISQLMDQSPSLRAPSTVLAEIAASETPDEYLRSLHPKHEQFELLRQQLLKLRGGNAREEQEEPDADPALSVKLPPGAILREGMQDPQVALLRKRLKVPADNPADEYLYDEPLREAVLAFQRANGLRPDAIIGNNTRSVLNGAPRPVAPSSESKIERILINMERWRWMPEDLGEFYVWDNVPEFLTRIVKNDKIIHTDKIIVGQPSWPTPIFSADMKTVVFNPSWGVPEGIKRKELLPLLRKSSGAGFFGIFGGGYSSQAVLDAYHLKVFYNGRQIDPNQVDWNSVNIAAYSFQQPPGPKNPLGYVKFMFPNSHDVYMHDTPERHLFVKSYRALSHGCMRIEEPRKFAEVILGEDKGWSPERVASMFHGGNTVSLDRHIPVHVTYFTARVDKDGALRTFGDIYGLDSRTAAALTGRSIRFEQESYPVDDDLTADASPYPPAGPRARKKQYQGAPTLSDAISDIFSP